VTSAPLGIEPEEVSVKTFCVLVSITFLLFLLNDSAIAQSCGSGQAFFVSTLNCPCDGFEYSRYNCSGVLGRCNNSLQLPCGDDSGGCTYLTAENCPGALLGPNPLPKSDVADPIKNALLERFGSAAHPTRCAKLTADFAQWANSHFRAPEVSKLEVVK
jgi:hypothetical protein